MNIQTLHLIQGAGQAQGLTVIIDVFRAFSLECYLYDMGAAAILPVGDLDVARRLKAEHPDYVLIGYDTTLDYENMTKVCDLVRAGLPYVATHPDFNCPTETGFAPDIGAIIAFIEASTGRRPDIILGKPYRGIVEEALQVTGFAKENLAMVGDRLYTDIATGVNFGMTSILVLSGETTQSMLDASEIRPSAVFGRLSDMIPYL